MKRPFATAAWLLLGYTVFVILWGAFVRATGSGAGCGSHWPLCNGELIPRSPQLETLIEFGHRLSSGVLGIAVVAFVIAAFRGYPSGHAVRKGAVWTLCFVIAESLIGAGLVTFEWVTGNDSEERMVVMTFHLVNTFLLLAVLTLTAWFASGERSLSFGGNRGRLALLSATAAAMLIVGASGAVTALGDTLFFTEGIQPEDSPMVARLLASRIYHPAAAILSLVLVGVVALRASRLGRPLLALYVLQLALGGLNVYLKAPVWMQVAHLAMSDTIWIVFIVLAAESFAVREASPPLVV